MKIQKLILSILAVTTIFTSCSDNDDTPEIFGDFDNGVIVSAEGNFGSSNGSVSFVNDDLTEASDFIYNEVNGTLLGGLIQSITFSGDLAYIILNDVNTITIVNRYTFEKVGEITSGLSNPRYMAITDGKGYITNWGEGADTTDDYLAVLDISSSTLDEETIPLDNGVEQIVSVNDKLYVTHKGAWSTNNIVSVIDLSNQNAVTEIEVDDNPDEIIVDDSGNLIVLSEGQALTWNDTFTQVLTATTSSIAFINTSTDTVTSQLTFPENETASYMSYENGNIYYYKSADSTVYNIGESSTSLATTGINVGSIYGMSVNDDNLYTVTFNFVDLSELTIYDLDTQNEIYSSEVGLGASKIYFN